MSMTHASKPLFAWSRSRRHVYVCINAAYHGASSCLVGYELGSSWQSENETCLDAICDVKFVINSEVREMANLLPGQTTYCHPKYKCCSSYMYSHSAFTC
jgi:hypothetical protein